MGDIADSNENLDVLSQLVEVNGEVKGRRGCSKKFDMRCSPCRLYSVVKSLDEESKELVREMGFGSLLGMRNCIVRRDLIFWLLERFDHEDGSIQLKKQKVMINSNVFANVIGIVDGGEQLPELEIEERQKNRYHERISLKHIESILKSGEKDKFFVKHFAMYVVGTLLMPTTATYVIRRIENSMECINDARSVRSKNWASMSFKFLVESTRQFKEKKSHYVCWYLYFLQLFFLHHVDGYNHYVDRSICPMSTRGGSRSASYFSSGLKAVVVIIIIRCKVTITLRWGS